MGNLLSYIHPEGWRFVGIFAAIAALSYLLFVPVGLLFALLTVWCLYFFRDPKRVTPQQDNLVISPADGIITLIKDVVPPAEFDLGSDPLCRVSVFLNVFDVHVNRAPVAGKAERIIYYAGKFINASLDKASDFNERNAVIIERADGIKIGVVQIAGLIARRIVSFINQNDTLEAGQRFGLIRFGSRVDVYLPKGILPKVILGQRVIGGETVIADLLGEQKHIQGRKH